MVISNIYRHGNKALMKIWVMDRSKVYRRREYFSIHNCEANITRMKATMMMSSSDLQFIRVQTGLFLQKRPQGLLPTRFVDVPIGTRDSVIG
jgi:hypothetical protein